MGLINQLSTNPLGAALTFLALIVSIGFHEFSHVLVATALGDTTGKQQGRLTLNPLAHLTLMGTLMILFLGVGWGKPAPFNPEALRYRRYGPTFVALGGPLSNLLLVAVFGLLWRVLLPQLGADNLLITFLAITVFFNAALAVFNLLPIPPLDGSHLIRSLLGAHSPLVQLLDRYGWQLLFVLVLVGLTTGGGILELYLQWGVGLILRLFGLA